MVRPAVGTGFRDRGYARRYGAIPQSERHDEIGWRPQGQEGHAGKQVRVGKVNLRFPHLDARAGDFGKYAGFQTFVQRQSRRVRGKKSHATALMVIVPLSLVSAILYLVQGRVTVMDALPWLPGSLLGAYLGSRLMPKISTGWLKLVFGGLMLWGGIRLL